MPLLQQIAERRQNPPKGDTREADPGEIIMNRMMMMRTLALGGTTATSIENTTLITMLMMTTNPTKS